MLIKPTECCSLMRSTCLLCQCLKDAELRGHHNCTGKRHSYNRISQRRWHNACSERNPLQEVLRNSIKSHNASTSFQFTIRLRSTLERNEESLNQSQELHACFAFSPKDPSNDRRRHPSRGTNTTGRHTEMFPFEHHRHIHRPGNPRDLIGDL